MINARSTNYQTIEFENPLTNVDCDSYILKLYIWKGFNYSVPGTATYSLTRKNYEASSGSEDVEIGKIVKSYLDPGLTDITTGADYITQNRFGNTWVKITVTYDDDSVEQTLSTITGLYGYGYGNEGLNPQFPADRILITNRIFKVSRNTLFTIPVYMDIAKTVSITTPGGTYSNGYVIPSTINSDDIIELITIDTSIISTSESYMTIKVDTTDIILLFDNDERYQNTDIFFINKHGGQETISMRKQRSEVLGITKQKYERSFGQPSDGIHQNVDFMINGKTSIRLNSGYIPELNNLTFKELLLSDRVWMRYNGETTPVNVKSSALDYKTREVDKLINYEIEFEQAYNEINTI